MSDRPRRTTRPPARLQNNAPSADADPIAIRPKRKAQDADPADILCTLLKSPKSVLTNMDISDLINASSWDMLSSQSQMVLKALLPPTAFREYKPAIESDHPSAADSMVVDQPASGTSSNTLDTSIFTDPHFLAAAHTFQDHIYSNWLSDAHAEKVKQFHAGVHAGTLSAPWKDDVWERNNKVASPRVAVKATASSNDLAEFGARAGEAAEIKLGTLVKNGVIRIGDVIAYRRNFMHLNLMIEKDVIIQSVQPKTYALTVLIEPGSTMHLPANLLAPQPSDPSAPTQAMTITSVSMLENGLLDVDGRVERSKRPNGNAWKCFTIWRWRGDVSDSVPNERGGRENHGTLFYLRGSYYHDR